MSGFTRQESTHSVYQGNTLRLKSREELVSIRKELLAKAKRALANHEYTYLYELRQDIADIDRAVKTLIDDESYRKSQAI